MTQQLCPIDSLNDIIGELSDLGQLLATACDALTNMPYGTDESRNHELDTVAALVRIARDMTIRTEQGVEVFRRAEPKQRRVPQPDDVLVIGDELLKLWDRLGELRAKRPVNIGDNGEN
jgi:hypothetical protein